MYCSIPHYLTPDDIVILVSNERINIPSMIRVDTVNTGIDSNGKRIVFNKNNIRKIINNTDIVYDIDASMKDYIYEDDPNRYTYRD